MEWFETTQSICQSPGEDNRSDEETDCPEANHFSDVQSLLACVSGEDGEAIVEALKTLRNMCEQNGGSRNHVGVSGLVLILDKVQSSKNGSVQQEALLTLCSILDGDYEEKKVSFQRVLSTPEVFDWIHNCLQKALKGKDPATSLAALVNPTPFLNALVHFVTMLLAGNSISQMLLRESSCFQDLINLYKLTFPRFISEVMTSSKPHPFVALWQTVNAALCFAVNNPRNEENQLLCLPLLPFLLSQLDETSSPSVGQSVTHLLAQSLSENRRLQDSFSFAGGMHVLAQHCLPKWTGRALLTALSALDAAVTDNSHNAMLAEALDIIWLLLHFLEDKLSSVALKTKSALALAHCLDAFQRNREFIQRYEGLVGLLTSLVRHGDPDLESVARYLFCLSVQEPSSKENEANHFSRDDEQLNSFEESEIHSTTSRPVYKSHFESRSTSRRTSSSFRVGSSSKCTKQRILTNYGSPRTSSLERGVERALTLGAREIHHRKEFGDTATENRLTAVKTSSDINLISGGGDSIRCSSRQNIDSVCHLSEKTDFKIPRDSSTKWLLNVKRNREHIKSGFRSDASSFSQNMGQEEERSNNILEGYEPKRYCSHQARDEPVQNSIRLRKLYRDIVNEKRLLGQAQNNEPNENRVRLPCTPPRELVTRRNAARGASDVLSNKRLFRHSFKCSRKLFYDENERNESLGVSPLETTPKLRNVNSSCCTELPETPHAHLQKTFLHDIFNKSNRSSGAKNCVDEIHTDSESHVNVTQTRSSVCRLPSHHNSNTFNLNLAPTNVNKEIQSQNVAKQQTFNTAKFDRDSVTPSTSVRSNTKNRNSNRVSTCFGPSGDDSPRSTCCQGCVPCCCTMQSENGQERRQQYSKRRRWSASASRGTAEPVLSGKDRALKNKRMMKPRTGCLRASLCPGCESSVRCEIPLLHSRNLQQAIIENWNVACERHRLLTNAKTRLWKIAKLTGRDEA